MTNLSFEAGEGAWAVESKLLRGFYQQPDEELKKLFDDRE